MKNLLLHLRLNMSIVLAPIFLWGFLLSEKRDYFNFGIAFIAFHIFLYGGSNAYNSYYDKDEGPIGGLKNPPKVTESLLYFSLSCKIIGLFLSLIVNTHFFIVYFLCLILSLIYSHPSTRWKSDPYLSLFTIAFGQGGLAFFAGWYSQTEVISNIQIFLTGILTTVFMASGMYPLTQLYQIDEDRKRNDITFAVKFGVKKTFQFSALSSFLSIVFMISFLLIKKSYLDLAVLSIFYTFFILQLFSWYKNYTSEDIMENYSKIMKMNYANGLGFIFYILFKIAF